MSAKKKETAKATPADSSRGKTCIGCNHAFLDNERKKTFCTHPKTVADLNGMTAMENPNKRPSWCKLEAKLKEE